MSSWALRVLRAPWALRAWRLPQRRPSRGGPCRLRGLWGCPRGGRAAQAETREGGRAGDAEKPRGQPQRLSRGRCGPGPRQRLGAGCLHNSASRSFALVTSSTCPNSFNGSWPSFRPGPGPPRRRCCCSSMVVARRPPWSASVSGGERRRGGRSHRPRRFLALAQMAGGASRHRRGSCVAGIGSRPW